MQDTEFIMRIHWKICWFKWNCDLELQQTSSGQLLVLFSLKQFQTRLLRFKFLTTSMRLLEFNSFRMYALKYRGRLDCRYATYKLSGLESINCIPMACTSYTGGGGSKQELILLLTNIVIMPRQMKRDKPGNPGELIFVCYRVSFTHIFDDIVIFEENFVTRKIYF